MAYVGFESASEKQAIRESKREAQQRILNKAEQEFQKKERRRKERQENEQWMLPSVSDRISGSSSQKCKKEKKKKRREKDDDDSELSKEDQDQDSEPDEWVEKDSGLSSAKASNKPKAAVANEDEKLERDSWMMSPSCFGPTVSREELRQRVKGCSRPNSITEEDKRRRQLLDEPGQHSRELNPFWKDGGTGLPTQDRGQTQSTLPNPKIGDGGYRWLERAYRRAKEQAAEEDRPLEEVAAERWGTLENLEKLLDEAAKKYKSDRRSGNDRSGHNSRHYHRPRDDRRRDESGDRHSPKRLPAPSSSNRRIGLFMAPKEHDDCTSKQPSSCGIRTSSTVPRWKKKEFIQERTEMPLDSIKPKAVEVETPARIVETPKHRTPSPSATRLTQKEMNDLGAKIIKAELMGNDKLASKLKARLEGAKDLKNSQPESENNKEEEVVIVKRTAWNNDRPEQSGARLLKKHRVETHDRQGQRARYFGDDDKYSLKQMFEREKMGTAEDHNAMFARLAGHGVQKTTEDFDMDDILESKANRHISDEQIEDQLQKRALREHQRSSSAMDNCHFCFNGRDTPKHLIVAIGINTYLSLPPHKSLTDGHCLIVPMQHVMAGTHLDEDVWSEVQIFRKGLTRMFEDQERDVVYFETSMNLKWFPHMVLHCVPLPRDVGNLAPMYFKKAIMESETEWSNNKKLVDLSQKDVRRAVPKGLPYFSIDFGLQGGFAHVIEDEKMFPKNFAQEIVGGMLDLDQSLWRRPRKESFDEQRKKVLQFADWWKPYDWTERLKE